MINDKYIFCLKIKLIKRIIPYFLGHHANYMCIYTYAHVKNLCFN